MEKISLVKIAYRSFQIALQGNQTAYQQLYKEYNTATQNTLQKIDTEQSQFVKKISDNIKIVQKYAPWRPKCYNLALTTVQLLTAHTIPHQLYMGFRNKDKTLEGHAWVKVGAKVICGERSDLYTYQRLEV